MHNSLRKIKNEIGKIIIIALHKLHCEVCCVMFVKLQNYD